MASDALNNLASEERRHVYKMLKLRVTAYPEVQLELSGILTNPIGVCSSETPHA
jgi:hypothetical protein